MFGQGQLMNKRPNMKMFNQMQGGRDQDDDDEPITSSFTKSKVDDDDDKFQSRDSDFPDFMFKKKNDPQPTPPKKETKIVLPKTPEVKTTPAITTPVQTKTPVSQTPQKPAPVSEKKKPEPTPQKADLSPKKAEPTPKKPEPTPKKAEPTPKQVEPTPKRPEITPKKVEPTPKKPEPKADATPKRPAPTPVKKETEPKKSLQEEEEIVVQQDASPIRIKRDNQPKQQLQSENKESGLDQINSQGFDISSLQRPAFVRKGKNTPQVQEVLKTLQEYNIKDDRIKVIEPRNLKVVSREFISSNVFYFDQKQTFKDPIYPPNRAQILQVPWKDGKKNEQPSFSKPSQFYSDRPIELFSAIDPNDVMPGGFKTFNLMKALATLAEQPLTIARILENQKLSSSGLYYARLFINGVWQFVPIDDSLPELHGGPSTDERVKKLAKGSAGFGYELWVSLIEKAFSKVYGSYEDIEVNPPSVKEYLWQLTGAPVMVTEKFVANSVVELNEKNGLNLPCELSYTVLGEEKGQVRLRNPWGWSGSESNKVKMVGNEGEFSVSVNDLRQNTRMIVAPMYREGYWSISHSVRQIPSAYSAFVLSVEKESNCFVSLIQLDERYFRNNLVSKYRYSFARVMVFDDQKDLIGDACGSQQYLSVELTLTKGVYTVIVCIDWDKYNHESDAPYDSTLHYYGSEKCQVKRVNLKKSLNLFSDLMASNMIAQGEKHTVSSNNNKNVVEYFYLSEEQRLFGMVWKNTSSEEILFKRDFRDAKQKNLFQPITFVSQPSNLSTDSIVLDIMQARNSTWADATTVDIKLAANGNFAVLFRQPDIKYSKETLKQAGLL